MRVRIADAEVLAKIAAIARGQRKSDGEGSGCRMTGAADEMTLRRDSERAAGYIAEWRPYRKRQIMLGQVQQILDEYRAHLPLTVRQVYYRMIAHYRHPKGKRFETTLGELLVDARRAREIPFEATRDDGITRGGGQWVDSLGQTLANADAWLTHHDLNRQTDQRLRIEVWCEAAGMIPQLQRVTSEHSIPVYSCGGFNSLTAIRQIDDDVIADGRDTCLLHLGDYDPSGVSIYERVIRDVRAFLADDAPDVEFAGVPVALTESQIEQHGLPLDPITTKDSRSLVWLKQGKTHKCELEALAPNEIAAALRDAIEQHIDSDLLRTVVERQRTEREALKSLPTVISCESLLEAQMRLRHARAA